MRSHMQDLPQKIRFEVRIPVVFAHREESADRSLSMAGTGPEPPPTKSIPPSSVEKGQMVKGERFRGFPFARDKQPVEWLGRRGIHDLFCGQPERRPR